MSVVTCLPRWKKDAPTHERLYELAELAREKPEFFDKWVIVYCEDNSNRFKTRYMQGEKTRTSDSLAVLSAGAMTIFEDTKQ